MTVSANPLSGCWCVSLWSPRGAHARQPGSLQADVAAGGYAGPSETGVLEENRHGQPLLTPIDCGWRWRWKNQYKDWLWRKGKEEKPFSTSSRRQPSKDDVARLTGSVACHAYPSVRSCSAFCSLSHTYGLPSPRLIRRDARLRMP